MWFLYRTLRTALKALRRNVMRSALTALGIIIGVAGVNVMMDIGQGSAREVRSTITRIGANNLMVQPGAQAANGVSYGNGTVVSLTPADAEVIARECPAVHSVAPIVYARTQIIYGSRNWVPFHIYGTTPAFLDVRDWRTMAAGDPFTDHDVRAANKVCLLGQTVVRELFGGEPAVGKEVRVQNVPFRVVGVLGRKGANMMGMDEDDVLIAPWTTLKFRVTNSPLATVSQASLTTTDSTQRVNSLSDLYPNTQQTAQALLYPVQSPTQAADTPRPVRFANVDRFMVRAVSTDAIPAAMRQIAAVLHERHHIRRGRPDDFTIRDMTEASRALASTSQLMTALLLAVALISLVVGGVGIMNIMLVSVTERTKEIGLRMAVGARARDILRQFLTEAVLLCMLGGAVGILLGLLGSYLVAHFLHWPTEFSLAAVVSSVAVSVAVGVGFGYYPAWKASRLDPIEALRYE